MASGVGVAPPSRSEQTTAPQSQQLMPLTELPEGRHKCSHEIIGKFHRKSNEKFKIQTKICNLQGDVKGYLTELFDGIAK